MKKEFAVHKNAVAHYYDNNTRRFLRFGKHKGTQNIHQQLWAPGVSTENEAINFANHLILKEIQKLEGSENLIIDLGCGVGGSLRYLAENSLQTIRFQGFTISKLQAELGQKGIDEAGLNERITIQQGDFLALPKGLHVRMAYAIEAFVHAADPARFFQSTASKLETGGRLILIDDFRTEKIPHNKKEASWIQDFQQGWHAHSLISIEQAQSFAHDNRLHLVEQQDLTPFLHIGRPRDKMIGFMIKLFGKYMKMTTYFQSLTGGYAKQQCIKNQLVTYQMLVFEKRA